MFGTTRSLTESLLNIGESMIAIFVFAVLAYVMRWIWSFAIEWGQQLTRKSAAKALVALDPQIQMLKEQ